MGGSSQTFKYGLAARRYLVLKGLAMLGEAAVRRENRDRVFLQAYRWTHSHALPSLRDNEECLERVRGLESGEDLEDARFAGVRDVRWGRVCWWVEAWYRDGVFGADPKGEGLTEADVLRDDPSQASHFYAETAYRRAVVTANDLLADAVLEGDPEWANWLHDQVYPYLVAVAFPVVERLPGVRRELEELWGGGVPVEASEARALRLDSVGVLVDAWTRSAVLAEPSVPRDESSREDLLEAVRDR